MKVQNYSITSIRIDGGTQLRAAIDEETVAAYAEAIKDGVEFPAVTVFCDGLEYWLADGFHRFHAYRRAGKDKIPAEVRQGEQRDAWLFALGANATHGKNRTNADKRAQVTAALNDSELSKWSDREIARQCKVSFTLVAHVRQDLSATNCRYEKPEGQTVMRNGTVYQQKAKAPLQDGERIVKAPKKSWQEPDISEALAEEGLTEADMHIEQSDADLIAELHQRITELLERVEALTVDDLGKKVNDQQTEIYGLRGRIQQLMGSEKAAQDNLKYHSDLIHKLRKIYGVETHKEILAAAQAQVA